MSTLGASDYTTVAAAILEGVGGAANIKSIDNCITRLRLEVKDSSLVDEKKIKSAGAAGVIRPSKTAVQVVIGTKVQFVADEFKNYVDNQKHNICEMKSYLRKNNPFFDRGGSGWNRFFVIYTIFNENIKFHSPHV